MSQLVPTSTAAAYWRVTTIVTGHRFFRAPVTHVNARRLLGALGINH